MGLLVNKSQLSQAAGLPTRGGSLQGRVCVKGFEGFSYGFRRVLIGLL